MSTNCNKIKCFACEISLSKVLGGSGKAHSHGGLFTVALGLHVVTKPMHVLGKMAKC